jgi:hypothetical protein
MSDNAPASEATTAWYIVKIANSTCQIVTQTEIDAAEVEFIDRWGPFASQSEATAKRVGLIRAGKCQPV